MASDAREQVMVAIETVMRSVPSGTAHDRIAAARAAFPGTPELVLYEALASVDVEAVEAWWQGVERTIDGEVIRKGIAGAAPKPTAVPPANPRDDFEDELDPTIPF